MNITSLSINRPSLIIVLFSVFALLGIIGYMNLNYELMPDFNQPVVMVKTVYPGADPGEVENSVSIKIEDALSNLEGVDYVVTKSLPNASVIIVNLRYGTDVDKTMLDAQRYIDNIRKDLPKDIQNPVMSKVSPNDLPIMSVNATSDLSSTVFYRKMTDEILPRLQQLKGVAEISIIGGDEREFQVNVSQDKLNYYKLSIVQVTEAIKRSGLDVPAGDIGTNLESNSVRLTSKYATAEDIAGVAVAMPAPGSRVFVRDVAIVTDGIKETTSVSRYNNKDGIGLLLKKQGDANAVEVSQLVRQEFAALEKKFAQSGMQFTIADDSTDNTIAAVHSVVFDLVLAVLLVALVMLLFLRSLRNSIIVLIAIPASLITAFAVMWLLGFTLNLMTLLAMSLIIGILVDDATVVLENIQRHLDKGTEKRKAAMDGRMEIGFSALSITLVDVVVFVPILFLQVFVADMLKQFSIVVITSTLTSLLVGFTLTPWLASRIGKKEDLQPVNWFNSFLLWFERQLEKLNTWYGNQLNWVLGHKLIFTGIVAVLFILTGVTMKQGIIGKELIATGDQGKFRMNLEFDKAVGIGYNDSVTNLIETYVLAQPEVEAVFSNIGGPSSAIGSVGLGAPNKSELTVRLKPSESGKRPATDVFMKELRDELHEKFPGINYSVTALGLIPKTAPIELTLSGNDADVVMQTANDLRAAIGTIQGADNVRLSVESGNPEYRIVPDNERMQQLGLSAGTVGGSLRISLTGNDDASLTENGVEYPVRVMLGENDRTDYSDLQRIAFTNAAGNLVEVLQFADIVQEAAPSLKERKNRQPSVTLTADALGRPSGTVADEVVAYLKKHPLPEGIEMTWGSDIKRQHDSFGALGSVLVISFILIYLIMVALYDSYVYPFVVLFSIPVAAIGAFLALNLSMNNISLFALLGLIMLMGLVVKNAILIVDFANQLKAKGLELKDALIEAGKERMRPILMTTLSMVIGMIPVAVATGTASEWKNGLAWVIIGGLLSSLVLTVYLVPMMYFVIDTIKTRMRSKS